MTGTKFNIKNKVATITLNAPEKHNALDLDDIKRLREFVKICETLDLIAIVVTGVGKSFCSGVFLQNFTKNDWLINPLSLLCEELERCTAVSICSLNGGAYGGGVELALSCDFRIGHSGTKITVPPARLGIHYEASGIARSIRVLGSQITRRLFLLAETFHSDKLLQYGFLDYLEKDKESVDSKTCELIAVLSSVAPLAVKGMKKTINEVMQDRLDDDKAHQRVVECFDSLDHEEGLKAFGSKRKPIFRGL